MSLEDKLIDLAIAEDIGDGDHSSLSCIPNDAVGEVQLMLKDSGVLAGVEVAQKVYQRIDSQINFTPFLTDGASVKFGDIGFSAKGRVHSLLQAERIVLNIMQRMSGIASQTNVYVKLIEGTRAKVLDTRKTTPGMRVFDKLAVRIGGGHNHRMGLYDMIMLKDNHVDFAGGVRQAIEKANSYLKSTGRNIDIEIETRNFDEIMEVIEVGGVKRIMLDNFSVENTRKAVALIDGRFEVESSGGITQETIRGYAETGVDFISVGALTHKIKSLDMNLKKV
ncbi:carboxylating nicotinate-nucleotide diphosphorylase [Perlabentimonas gracilis]|uniref:carboxylating nicotinate-nucleotide diphosphorylase n=1 Tax=Perlabentimonas gracilis TaxID=2715279 RepID=UPI00140E59E8|nr:carboxylating nicotinate-nucleotide diphosphorylase [Perlabentimonas gracilis]NHB69696.1 carboxylating nicotinate-nucleotide diphosphorylase [Perlabentimonas gracilis]